MPGGKEIRTRTFRWRSITVRDSGASNMAIIELVASYLDDKRLAFSTITTIGPQAVSVEYGPAFGEETRKILFAAIKEKWPKASVGFYGEEVVTILRHAVCLDQHIQGSDS